MNIHTPPGFEDDIRKVQQLEAQVRQHPQTIMLLIQTYEQIVGRLQPEVDPLFYAAIQTNLGAAYGDLLMGDYTANLTHAITCYQEALRIWTPETAPLDYALTQYNLGNAYSDLPTGNHTDNLTHAITCYQEALRIWTPETAPLDYALTQHNLGAAYSALPTGDRSINLERAIACYQEALRFQTPETAPLDYALTQHNLGVVYSKLPTGDRAAHLTQAIAHYQEALRFQTPETTPLDYALTQHSLGTVYSDLPTGDRTANLSRAIACYREALCFRTPETAPLDYALTQHNLGNAYWRLPAGDHTANLTQAIACYREALRFRTPETAPLDYASTQTSLGIVYSELPTGDRATNLARAIACYQEALRFQSPETTPLDYALTQHNLGTAYSGLPTGNREANLAQAIACYQAALCIWTPETAPLDYALAQSNLGLAYWKLLTGDRAANLTQAIACYREALRFQTPEGTPFDYAFTQNNLGNAYRELPTGDRGVNLTQAMTSYQEALRFRTPTAAPLEYAVTKANLGNAYSDLPTGDRAANLTQAIACYQEALRTWTPETAPLDYALTQANLGAAYSRLPVGDRALNFTQALACYQEALRIWTPETAPFDYALVKHNQGVAFGDLPTGERAINRAQAIACYQEALRFRTPEAAPSECRMTNHNLADLYFAQREWHAALDAYQAAMEAGERLYHAGLSAESKATEVAENAALYRHATFCAVRCGKSGEALLLLERGKTRLLAETLRLRILRPSNVPDEVWSAFEQAGATVRAAQTGRTAIVGEESDLIQAYATRQQAVRAAIIALNAAIDQVRSHVPNFLHPIELSAIQALLPDERTALVAFCITEHGSMGLVVSYLPDREVQVVEVPDFTQAGLHALFVEQDSDGGVVGGWLVDYPTSLTEHSSASSTAWQETITRTLAILGQHLLTPILSTLSPGIERILFLPSAELFLLPLHTAPLSGGDAERVCDRYQVSYAPSLEVLADIQARAVQDASPELYAVINPQEDPRLVFAANEGKVIAQLFAEQRVDEGRAGTKQGVIAGVQGRSYVHFACHGSYDWDDPTTSGLDLTNGRLTLAELQRGVVDLSNVRLVTLSACETGITDVVKGSAEEYVGIPAGFLVAGVRCVVSSLWAVPDLSTALLMERFYRNHLKGGMDVAAALREAQVWVRNLQIGEVARYAERCYQQARQDEKGELFKLMRYYRAQARQNSAWCPFAHPYYWAAFTVNGM